MRENRNDQNVTFLISHTCAHAHALSSSSCRRATGDEKMLESEDNG
jgi:hypothetical protein